MHHMQHSQAIESPAALPPLPSFSTFSAACIAVDHPARVSGTPREPMCSACYQAYTAAYVVYKRAERKARRAAQPDCQFCTRVGAIQLGDGTHVCWRHATSAVLPPAADRQALARSGRALIAAAEAGQPIGIELYAWALLARDALDTAQLLALFLVMAGSCYRTVEDGEGDRWIAAGRALQAVLNDEQFGRAVQRVADDLALLRDEETIIAWGRQRRNATLRQQCDDIAAEKRDLRDALRTLRLLERRSPRWIDTLRGIRARREAATCLSESRTDLEPVAA